MQHDKNGKLIGNPAQCDWLKDGESSVSPIRFPVSDGRISAVPWGFRKLLRYINERYLEQYPGMKLYVTEQVSVIWGNAEQFVLALTPRSGILCPRRT